MSETIHKNINVKNLNWQIDSSTVSVLNRFVCQNVLAFVFLHQIVSRKVVLAKACGIFIFQSQSLTVTVRESEHHFNRHLVFNSFVTTQSYRSCPKCHSR